MSYLLYSGRFFSCESHERIDEFAGIVVDRVSRRIVKCYKAGAPIEAGVQQAEEAFLSEFPGQDIARLPEGTFALPGFYDAHIHAIASGVRQTKGLDLSECQGWDEASAKLRLRQSSGKLQSGWLIAGGWRRTWFVGEEPSSALLDASVSSDACVYLRERDGHCVWLNSRAYDQFVAGCPHASELEAGGLIRQGLLFEKAADAASKLLPGLSLEEYQQAIKYAQCALVRKGIVGYQEAGLSERQIEAYLALYHNSSSDLPRPRIRLLTKLTPNQDQAALLAALTAAQERLSRGGGGATGEVRVDGIKIYLDGLIEERTAALNAPYSPGPCCLQDPRSCHCAVGGKLLWSNEALNALVDAAAASAGVVRTLHVHAIGDAAVAQAAAAARRCREATRIVGGGDVEVQVAHVQLAAAADLEGMEAVGWRAVLSPLWFNDSDGEGGPVLLEALGEQRFNGQYAVTNMPPHLVSFGSDYPVSSFDPIMV